MFTLGVAVDGNWSNWGYYSSCPVEQATRQRRDTVTTQPQAMVEAHAMEVTATPSAAMLVIAKVPDVLSILCSVFCTLYTL